MKKIKWNWGSKIATVFIGFVLLILFMVFKSVNQKSELVSDNYYAEEIAFGKAIEKKNNANLLEENVKWKITNKHVVVNFPSTFDPSKISGIIEMFRPSDLQLDLDIPVKVREDHSQNLELSKFKTGKYNIKVDWSYEGEEYLTEGSIFIP